MKPSIEIHRLGKKYRVGKSVPYLSLRDAISCGIRDLLYKNKERTEDFWALQDINFKIEAGERVGIIGRNGAGKSTLLKILSRVTWPTTGEAIIRGRLSSLLEVGTGFHPELSGRENIYLNGSVLGLKKKEIDRQFDAIVDFSGVETFLETPIKYYSSGMQLRLAFAVAAHLEPEILIIDEVLAVGDLEFKKKCIGKMEEVNKQDGRTILFVSHDLKAINDFCNRTIWMESGRIKQNDSTNTVTNNYINSTSKISPQVRNGNEPAVPIFINKVSPVNNNQKDQFIFKLGEKAGVLVGIKNRLWSKHFSLGLGLNTLKKGRILSYSIDLPSVEINRTKQIVIWLPFEELTPGVYTFDISISNDKNEVIDLLTNVGSFEIPEENTHYQNLNYDYGVFYKDLVWHEIN